VILWYNGRYNNFVHLGSVIIEDDVTVGTNVSVPRGMLEDTIIDQEPELPIMYVSGIA
jgi:UDP-3-O-[3-hydroxymyristoyl] glucosamine N-acyltransferase